MLEFCENFVYHKGQPISFVGRPYLAALYACRARRLVLRASRQVEKTTFLINTILYTAVMRPRVHILFICPRLEQARVFCGSRLLPTLQDSPLLRRILLGQTRRKPPIMNLRFANGSELYVRAAFHSADAARGLDADVLLVDEFQDIAGGDLPVLEETLSHSELRKVVLTGTPKNVDNHLEGVFAQSTASEFLIPCKGCARNVILDETCLEIEGPTCPQCQTPCDMAQGRWVARNPSSSWGAGYWLNYLMVPWRCYPEFLEKQRTYDPARFRNECLGLPSILGDHIVTRRELEACCSPRPMARSPADTPPRGHRRLVAGIDWGGGGVSRTVVAVGYMEDNNRFMVVFLERFPPHEQPEEILKTLAIRLEQLQVIGIAADGGGNGSVYNPLLLNRLPALDAYYSMLYSAADQEPRQHRGRLWHWTVGRTPSIGLLFARIKKKLIDFPQLGDCGSFLDEICCEVAQYDEHFRTIKYTHPETLPDDTLHALNYAVILGQRWFDLQSRYGNTELP